MDSKAEESVTKFSKLMISSIIPDITKVKDELRNLSVDISKKTIGINSKMIEIDTKLINFRVGRAIREYVYLGLICLVVGVFSTLAITRQCYGGLQKIVYAKEIELAKDSGIKLYKKDLIEKNSGMISILKLEKEYLKLHMDYFQEPDAYLQNLNERIKEFSSSKTFKD